jgi:hypothetical protein
MEKMISVFQGIEETEETLLLAHRSNSFRSVVLMFVVLLQKMTAPTFRHPPPRATSLSDNKNGQARS